jgi:hypothetical protein
MTLGVCVLAAPEIVVGAVVVAGVVVVGFALKEALDAYGLKWAAPEDARPAPQTRPVPEMLPRRLVDGDVSTLVDGHAARMESPHWVMEWAGRRATGS